MTPRRIARNASELSEDEREATFMRRMKGSTNTNTKDLVDWAQRGYHIRPDRAEILVAQLMRERTPQETHMSGRRPKYKHLPQEEREALFIESMRRVNCAPSYCVTNGVRVYFLTRERARELGRLVQAERDRAKEAERNKAANTRPSVQAKDVFDVVQRAYFAGLPPQLAGQLLTDLLKAREERRE